MLIGQTREKIEETAHKCGFMNTILADNLEEAVKICAEKANKGDAVLLSPACASWGQFDNTNSVVGCSKNMYTPCRRQMRNESRRGWSLQVEEGGIVQEVLRKQAGFTKKEISRAKFLPDGIRKNGTRCRVTEKTLTGDIIEILLETETQTSAHLAVNTEVLDILYEDQDLLAVNKPAGVVTHPQGGHYEDTLANQVSAYYAFRQESHTVRPIGRLDKDTSGIVLFAKNQTAAARLQKQRERGELQKTYLAVTEISVKWNDDTKKHKKDIEEKNKVEKFPGWSEIIRRMEEYETTADPDGWTRIDTPMAPDPENRLRMIPTPLGKPARTLYKPLWTGKANQCFALHLETGRTHQIRLHMATLKCPLLGDPLYGGDQTQLHRAALHAYGVTLYQPYTGEKLHLTAPIPEDIRNLDLG